MLRLVLPFPSPRLSFPLTLAALIGSPWLRLRSVLQISRARHSERS
jgi:hypothetical protein